MGKFIDNIGTLLLGAGALIAGLAVGMKADARWFGLYGWATTLLLMLPFVQYALWKGLRARGRKPWTSLIVTLPLAIVALGQIGFWAAFFHMPELTVNLGVVRGALWHFAGPYAEWIIGVYAALCALIAWRALR
jgi:hypothetical protein